MDINELYEALKPQDNNEYQNARIEAMSIRISELEQKLSVQKENISEVIKSLNKITND